jgi:hypothetical protein
MVFSEIIRPTMALIVMLSVDLDTMFSVQRKVYYNHHLHALSRRNRVQVVSYLPP